MREKLWRVDFVPVTCIGIRPIPFATATYD
jgi:hypothetical protein